MDDLEFRTRAFSNPHDDQADFSAASESDPDKRRLVNELIDMDKLILKSFSATPVPPGLRSKLLDLTTKEHQSAKTGRYLSRPAYALAASLVLATGLGFSVTQSRPNAADLALHDALLAHLHHEAPRYSGTTAIQWSQVEAVLHAAGASLANGQEVARLHLTFANLCGLGGSQRGAHIVALGQHGPVSIIFINNTPVSTRVKLKDDRFKGQIIPLEQGNMAVIGEKAESLGRFEKMMRSNLEWSI
jgi:hypothetical protein